MILLLLSCRPATDALPPSDPFVYGTPEITELEWSCNEEEAQWEFVVSTDAWTSNGELWMAAGELAEKHDIVSVGATADGSADKLRLRLDVVPDWRDAEPGSTTRWPCSDVERLSFLLWIHHPQSGNGTDCRFWGTPIWESVADVPECSQELLSEDSG
jgi:hypothetical protein